jgi:hypothetical protein
MPRRVPWEAIFRPGIAADFFQPAAPGDFDPAAGAFSPVNAWWLSELSRLVYRSSGVTGPSRDRILAGVGLGEAATFRRRGIFGALVASQPGAGTPFAVLAFRGSSGRLDNWVANFNLPLRAWPAGGRVHAGFKAALLGIWPEIRPALDALNRPVFYTGHSLGAALAILAASLCPPRGVYTFGAPRVGDARFARRLQTVPVYRLAAARDMVTRLPPAGFPFGYRHAGTVRTLRARPQAADGSFCGQPAGTAPGWLRLLDRLAAPPVFLADHAPVRYTDALYP